jgi:hypothetical protein
VADLLYVLLILSHPPPASKQAPPDLQKKSAAHRLPVRGDKKS